MIHQPGRFYILIEVEKEATQSVFFFLKEEKYPVFVDPTEDIFKKYIFFINCYWFCPIFLEINNSFSKHKSPNGHLV